MTNYAKEYCDAVLAGDIIACEKVKLAAKRFLKGLEYEKDDSYPYYFDEAAATKAIKFIELIPSTDGSKINALMFQKWIISELYGWKEKATGNRRYKQAFISTARKQGKTWLASSIGALSLIAETKPAEGRQVLFVANAIKQARLGYNMLSNSLSKVCRISEFMKKQLIIGKQQITHKPSNSFAMALSSDLSTLDGYSGTTVIVDEYALARSRDVLNTLKSGQKAEPNALLAVVSTAGYDLNVPMYQDYQFYSDVLHGKATAESTFIAIYELDDKEEATPECSDQWIKACPIFEHEDIKETMLPAIKEDVITAQQQGTLTAVLTKSFNMWTQASESSYIAADDWEQAEVEAIDIKGKQIFLGIDLSKTDDLTSVSWLIPTDDQQLYCDSHSWIGTKYGLANKIKSDGVNYIELERKGECSITKLDSGIIDYEDIFNWVMRFIEDNELQVVAVCYDKWNSNTLITKFEKANLPLVEVRQGTYTLNTPTRTFRERLYNGEIVHVANTLLAHAVNNAILKEDNNGVMISKKRNANKIDPIAALINAYTEAMFHFEEAEEMKRRNEIYSDENFSF
ncbi:terminase large subunit [Kurthia populi]|uniref:Terminase large subunit n=1 Tax=Kurthia populi TaxID=1562132 RepID=A0ABW5Y2Q1_9BACL